MGQVCEVCQTLSESTGALVTSRKSGTFRVVLNERVVTLCVEHADEAIAHGTRTLSEIRAHFSEPFPGQRSLVPRRAGDDNAPGDERRRRGRRAGDRV